MDLITNKYLKGNRQISINNSKGETTKIGGGY